MGRREAGGERGTCSLLFYLLLLLTSPCNSSSLCKEQLIPSMFRSPVCVSLHSSEQPRYPLTEVRVPADWLAQSPGVWGTPRWDFLNWILLWIPEATALERPCPLLRGFFTSSGVFLLNFSDTKDQIPQMSGSKLSIQISLEILNSTNPNSSLCPHSLEGGNCFCSRHHCAIFQWNFIA